MSKKNGNKIYQYSKVFIILALLIVMLFTSAKSFYTFSNLSSLLQATSLYGIMACGMMFPLLVSGPDLSISGSAAIGGMVCVKFMAAHGFTTGSFVAGLLLALLTGAVTGGLMGAVCHYFNVPSFLITLSMQYVFYGIAQIGLKSRVVATQPAAFTRLGNGNYFGFPLQVYIFLGITVLSWFIMHRTVYGRKCFAVGGNRKASKLCGIPSASIEITAFALSGITAALTGVILAAMTQKADSTAAGGYETEVLLACVLGGAGMGQGIGSIGGAVYGAFFVALLKNCLRLAGVPSLYQTMLVGILIIVAMSFDTYFKMKAAGMVRKKKKKGEIVDTRSFS